MKAAQVDVRTVDSGAALGQACDGALQISVTGVQQNGKSELSRHANVTKGDRGSEELCGEPTSPTVAAGIATGPPPAGHSDASSSERLQHRFMAPLLAGANAAPLSPQSYNGPEDPGGNPSVHSQQQGLELRASAAVQTGAVAAGPMSEEEWPSSPGPRPRGRRARGGNAALTARDALHKVRSEMMHLEECVPWTLVRRAWRTKRSAWRRGLRCAETTSEVAKGMREFRLALVEDIDSGESMGPRWERSVDQCANGQGSWTILLALWTEMNHWVACWLDARELPQPIVLTLDGVRALRALQNAARRGEDCLAQVPLELMLNNNSESLRHLKIFLERERRMLVAKRDVVMYGNQACGVDTCPAADPAGHKPVLDIASHAATESDGDSDATVRSS